VLPLQFREGESAETLGLDGTETYEIRGIEGIRPRSEVEVIARRDDGSEVRFKAVARLDTPVEVEYYSNGGILQTVLRKMLRG